MAQPGTDCPDFCTMHTDTGACVGEFDGPGALEGGWHVYSRPRQEPDGTPGVEIAVVKDAGPITRVVVPTEPVPYQP